MAAADRDAPPGSRISTSIRSTSCRSEPAVARQLTSTPGAKRSAQFTPDSKEVYYLDAAASSTSRSSGASRKPLAVTAELDVDFAREKLEAFQQAWTYLRDKFFDEKMNGVDWNARADDLRAARRRRAHARRDAPHHLADARRAERVAHGHLPRRRRRRRRRSAGWRSTSIAPSTKRTAAALSRGRAARPGGARRASSRGEYPRCGRRASRSGRATNLDELLDHTIGKRIALSVASSPTRPAREVVVKPIESGDRERAALPAVGRAEARVRREGERRPARLRAHVRHVSGRAVAAAPRSRCRQPRARRRRHRRAQQQRRLRERLRDRRVRAPRLLQHVARGAADGVVADRRSASARSSCRRSSSPTSTRCRTRRTSPKAIAR